MAIVATMQRQERQAFQSRPPVVEAAWVTAPFEGCKWGTEGGSLRFKNGLTFRSIDIRRYMPPCPLKRTKMRGGPEVARMNSTPSRK